MPYPHKYITLTPEEAKKIEKALLRLALARKWRRRDPLQALYLSGWGVGERGGRGVQRITFQGIAEHFGVDYSTVKNWFRRYRKEGLDAFIEWINRPILPPRKKTPKGLKSVIF